MWVLLSPVSFNDIDNIVRRCIGFSNGNIAIANSIFRKNGLDFVMIDVGEGNGVGNGNTAPLLLPNGNIRWPFVQTNAETFQLLFDDLFIAQRLQDV
jgi:hypothetical protein